MRTADRKIGPVGLLVVRVGHLERVALGAGDAGGVDHDVDRSETLDRRCDERIDLAWLVTSAFTPIASPPSVATSRSSTSVLMSLRTSRTPSCARSLAVAQPMPSLAR